MQQRLISILLELMRGKTLSAPRLAAEMEVSLRTIYRDMDALSAAGIPIQSLSGKQGGFRIMDGYSLRDLPTTREEKRFLLSVLRDLAPTSPEAAALVRKLYALERGEDSAHWLQIDMGEQDETFHACRKGIEERRVVSFVYLRERGSVARDVEPLTLLFRGGQFYLFAFCRLRNNYRLFRLSRMREIHLLEEGFQPRPMSLRDWERAHPYNAAPALVLKAALHRERSVMDDFPAENVSRETDGYRIELHWWVDSWVIALILSYGPDIRVLWPPWLQRDVAELSEKAAQNHRHNIEEETKMENMDNMKFCQSCAMPLTDDILGTEKDGSPNHDYCSYCYKDGAFTQDCTMEEMIEFCVPMVSKGEPYPDEETARKAMAEFFPTLKRWKK